MGAWGMKPFENDGAGDFEAELCLSHPDDPDFILAVLESIDQEEYLEVDAGQAVIACAAFLAYMNGLEDDSQLSERFRAWIDKNKTYNTASMIPMALQALDRVTQDAESCEIYDLWLESEHFDEWKESVDKIYAYLQTLQAV
jgi:hypothetical protein